MSGVSQEQFLSRQHFENNSSSSPRHLDSLSPISRMRSPNIQQQQQQQQQPSSESTPIRHSLFQTTPPAPNRGGSPLPPPPMAAFDPIRLQQLYTLALADKMRLFHHQHHPGASLFSPYPPPGGHPLSLGGPGARLPLPPPPPPPPHHGSHPMDFAYAYGKFDPRFFRVPDEPKPQHSYIGLIAMAILSSKEHKLVLADIYQYILDNFSYFRHRGPGWRNSIRHNLSLNDCFVKAGRAANGKGHFWAIHPACIDDFKRGDFRRRKAQRKVRRHMGLAVDEEDSPSPPPPPSLSPGMGHGMGLPLHWLAAAGLRPPPPQHFMHPLHRGGFAPHLPAVSAAAAAAAAAHSAAASANNNNNNHHNHQTVSPPTTVKRQFDVASLLGDNDVSPSTEGIIAKRLREEVEERILKSQIERKFEESNKFKIENIDDVGGQDDSLDVVSLVGEDDGEEHQLGANLDEDDDDLEAKPEPEEEDDFLVRRKRNLSREEDDRDSNDDGNHRRERTNKSPMFASHGFPSPTQPIFSHAFAAAAMAVGGGKPSFDGLLPQLPPSALTPQEYLARYYQIMQQQQQSHNAAAALSAAAAQAAASSAKLNGGSHRSFEASIEQQTN